MLCHEAVAEHSIFRAASAISDNSVETAGELGISHVITNTNDVHLSAAVQRGKQDQNHQSIETNTSDF